jgi:hypothetical protein
VIPAAEYALAASGAISAAVGIGLEDSEACCSDCAVDEFLAAVIIDDELSNLISQSSL